MKPPAFDFVRAETIKEALSVLADEGSAAAVLAGGQTLLAMLNMRLARPRTVVDIMRIEALRQIDEGHGRIRVGAAVRQAELFAWPQLSAKAPLLAKVLPWVAHPQIRGRGTVCGSIAHADPSAELPLALLALEGTVHLRSRKRARDLSADAFIVGMMATARGDDELIEAVSFPVREPGAGYAFREVGRRQGDFAIVACAAVATGDGVRLAVGGVADRPEVRRFDADSGAALDEALNAFAYTLQARDDIHASARYRRELVRRIGRQVIEEAMACRA